MFLFDFFNYSFIHLFIILCLFFVKKKYMLVFCDEKIMFNKLNNKKMLYNDTFIFYFKPFMSHATRFS